MHKFSSQLAFLNMRGHIGTFAFIIIITIWSCHRLKQDQIPVSVNTQIGNSNASGGRLNKKDGLTRYGDSHVKDKTS